MGGPDRLAFGSCGLLDFGAGCGGRDHTVSALLRVHFPTCPLRTARYLYGICISSYRHRLADCRSFWRQTASSLRRGCPPASTHVVGGGRSWRSDGAAALDL